MDTDNRDNQDISNPDDNNLSSNNDVVIEINNTEENSENDIDENILEEEIEEENIDENILQEEIEEENENEDEDENIQEPVYIPCEVCDCMFLFEEYQEHVDECSRGTQLQGLLRSIITRNINLPINIPNLQLQNNSENNNPENNNEENSDSEDEDISANIDELLPIEDDRISTTATINTSIDNENSIEENNQQENIGLERLNNIPTNSITNENIINEVNSFNNLIQEYNSIINILANPVNNNEEDITPLEDVDSDSEDEDIPPLEEVDSNIDVEIEFEVDENFNFSNNYPIVRHYNNTESNNNVDNLRYSNFNETDPLLDENNNPNNTFYSSLQPNSPQGPLPQGPPPNPPQNISQNNFDIDLEANNNSSINSTNYFTQTLVPPPILPPPPPLPLHEREIEPELEPVPSLERISNIPQHIPPPSGAPPINPRPRVRRVLSSSSSNSLIRSLLTLPINPEYTVDSMLNRTNTNIGDNTENEGLDSVTDTGENSNIFLSLQNNRRVRFADSNSELSTDTSGNSILPPINPRPRSRTRFSTYPYTYLSNMLSGLSENSTYEENLELANTIGIVERGVKDYDKVVENISFETVIDNEYIKCPICQDEFTEEKNIILTIKCKHAYCYDCLKIWLDKSTKCPTCMCDIETEEI